jgi:hypothetical protein
MPVLNPIENGDARAVGDPPEALAAAHAAASAALYDVQANRVDYVRFAHADELGDLVAVAEALADYDCARLAIGARLAFWLNVYNALVLHAVAVRGTAPRRLDKDFFVEAKYEISGHEFSLDDVEHGLIRCNGPRFRSLRRQMAAGDPRLTFAPLLFDERAHFALHSACASSPRLRVYDRAGLDATLEDAACDYVRQQAHVQNGGAALLVPKIFQWYAPDFGGDAGVRAFVIGCLESEEDIDAIDRHGANCALRYAEFDWTVNQR